MQFKAILSSIDLHGRICHISVASQRKIETFCKTVGGNEKSRVMEWQSRIREFHHQQLK